MNRVVVALALLLSSLLVTGSPADAADSTTADRASSRCHRTLAAYPDLEPGDQGRAVRTLQCTLNDLGVGPVVVDGDYGPQTVAAVAEIEKGFEGVRPEPGLIDDGFWVLLFGRQLPDPLPAYGDRGKDVKTLQRALRAAGYDIVVDGDYAEQTRAVVRAYRRACGDLGFMLGGGCAPG